MIDPISYIETADDVEADTTDYPYVVTISYVGHADVLDAMDSVAAARETFATASPFAGRFATNSEAEAFAVIINTLGVAARVDVV